MSQVTEAQIAAVANVAPRVTLPQIEALMKRVTYRFENPAGTSSTFAHAYLDDKFYLATGHSASVSLENFNADLGQELAQGRAKGAATGRLWELEGYALFKSLNQPEGSHIERMVLEQNVLSERLGKLQAFMETELFRDLPSPDRDLLDDQLMAMALYNQALMKRVMRSKATV